jgi:hypothetical protein
MNKWRNFHGPRSWPISLAWHQSCVLLRHPGSPCDDDSVKYRTRHPMVELGVAPAL